MGEVRRSTGLSKIHLVRKSRKFVDGLEFSGRQLAKTDPLAVVLDSFNRLNSLTEPQCAGVGIAKRQIACGIRQTRVNFDPGGGPGNDTDSGVEGLRVDARDACETQERESRDQVRVRTKHASQFSKELRQS